ncbi:MAG: NFACT family protein [Firmicutes bacterium]|nr:NFACT family protein [Bacillota bacterium]
MAYDTFVLAACIKDIKEAALGAKINRLHQPNKHQLILRFYSKNGAGRLLLCAEAETARLHLTSNSLPNPAVAPLFLMVARKWLEGAVLQSIEQTPHERVATLSFLAKNEVGDPCIIRIIVEIMGKHSNIIITDEHGIIIDGIHRYDSRLSRYREILPQKLYKPPPPQKKVPPLFMDEETLAQVLLQDDWQEKVAVVLTRRIAGISPFIARELLVRSGLRENLLLEEAGSYELTLLFKQINILFKQLDAAAFAPTLLSYHNDYRDYAAFLPFLWQGQEQRAFPSMSEALDAYYLAKQQKTAFAKQQSRLSKALQQNITRLQKKISMRQAELLASEQGESYKEAGDLLAAHLYDVVNKSGKSGRGLEEVYLPSFSEPVQIRRIELDAALTPQKNIQRYYHKYNKCRKANTAIAIQLGEAQEELAYLQSINFSIFSAQIPAELDEIEKELNAVHILPALPPIKGKKTPQQNAALEPRRYISADGFPILVGRNNKQNDRLSLKIAATDDIWLHTQKIPGSHVIIVCQGKNPPQRTLQEAASYAVWFSQAREAGKTAVDYTKASQVKKPSGAKPGMVIYFQQQTIYVEPVKPEELKAE